MTTTLQFSVYDMCHCYNNLNSTHTLNMIVYFYPFGLQFELLQQTQMRWPSWFQDLESYQPMGAGLSLVQLTAVIWCSFARTKLTKPLHQTTCSTMPGAFVTLMAMAASCSRKIPAPLGQAYSTGGEFTTSATTPCSSGSIIWSSNQSSIISHRWWLPCYATSIRQGGLCLHIIPWVSWITISRDSSTQLVAR